MRFAIPLAVALILALSGSQAHAEAQRRRIATLAPEGSLWMKQLRRGAAMIEKLTDGRVQTKYYAGGSQGDERDVVRKMRLGQLDGAALTSVGLGLIYPGIRVMELPFLYDNVGEIDYVRRKMWPYFQGKFREKGFELLAAGDVGWVHLFSNRAIDSDKALTSLKMWAWKDDPIVRRLFKTMGLDGVPLGAPEVLPALNTGRIDACYGSPLAAVALQWHTRITHMAAEPVGYGVGGMVMRTEAWEAASPEDRDIQMKYGRKQMVKSIARVRKDNKRALDAMKKNGLAVIELPPALRKRLEANAKKLWQSLVGELYTQEELDMVLKHRDAYRKQHGHTIARGAQSL